MAAGSTYTPIATTTLGSAAASYTFSSIPQTYTDLVLIINPNSSVDNMNYRFNSDTGTNYSSTYLFGSGSSTLASRNTNATVLNGTISGGWEILQSSIFNYSNATTYKTAINRQSDASNYVGTNVGVWRSSAAITSITILAGGPGNIPSGAVLTLYGIQAA